MHFEATYESAIGLISGIFDQKSLSNQDLGNDFFVLMINYTYSFLRSEEDRPET